MKSIYISSLAFLGKPVEEIIEIVNQHNWSLEFSSGMPYRADMEKIYLEAPIKKIPHNYFPAPLIPFVLNLASANQSIRKVSIEHCKKGLWLSQQSRAPFFSAHAGFCIDPDPNQLGRKIQYDPDFDKAKNKELFIASVNTVLQMADELGVDFLIENNVIASFNLNNRKINPLLCCESTEIEWLFSEINNPRLGLLLDTAHLKVSCRTLNLRLEEETRNVLPFIKAIHHSDNDGLIDDNQEFKNDYWFLPYLKKIDPSIVHVVEVKNISTSIIEKQINLLLSHGC